MSRFFYARIVGFVTHHYQHTLESIQALFFPAS
jgi:hypothetical protein